MSARKAPPPRDSMLNLLMGAWEKLDGDEQLDLINAARKMARLDTGAAFGAASSFLGICQGRLFRMRGHERGGKIGRASCLVKVFI